MAEISLRLKQTPVVPDFESCVYALYEDTANPLETGEFPEIPIRVQITAGTEATTENVESIMAEALEKAKNEAQEKANKRDLQLAFKPLLANYAENAPEELFTGKVAEVTEYVKIIDVITKT
jgi:hypothetical protein